MAKKTNAELLAENRLLRRSHLSTAISSTIRDLFKYTFLTSIPICAYLAIASLSGQETKARIVVNFLGNVTINQWVAWAVAGGSSVAFMRERKLRKKTTATLTTRTE